MYFRNAGSTEEGVSRRFMQKGATPADNSRVQAQIVRSWLRFAAYGKLRGSHAPRPAASYRSQARLRGYYFHTCMRTLRKTAGGTSTKNEIPHRYPPLTLNYLRCARRFDSNA